MNKTSMDQGAVLRWICSLIWVMAKRATDTWQVLWEMGLLGFRYVWNMCSFCFFWRDCRSSRFHLVLFLSAAVLGDFVVSISGLVHFLTMCFFTSRCRLGSLLWEARYGIVASRDCGWAKRWRGLGKTIRSCTLLVCATWIYGCFGRPGQTFHGECRVFPGNNASKSCFGMLPSWRCLSLDVARRSETTFLIEQTSGEFPYSCLLFTALSTQDLHHIFVRNPSTKQSRIHPNLFRFASSRIGCSLSTPRSSGSSPYHRYRIVVEYHERQVSRNTIAPSVWRLGARTGQEASRVVEEGRVGWWWQHPTLNVMMTTSQRLKASHSTPTYWH